MAQAYGNVYVASVSLSHMNHLVTALSEAEAYEGPSLIIACASTARARTHAPPPLLLPSPPRAINKLSPRAQTRRAASTACARGRRVCCRSARRP